MSNSLSSRIHESIGVLLERLTSQGLKVVTAESCTGGLLAQWFTSFNGSSKWFECGFVTYSNDSKRHLLGVQAETLNECGAVSKNVAKQMALGALKNSSAKLSVSITGIAGPDGGSEAKPLGTVYIAAAGPNRDVEITHHLFTGDRQAVREQAVHAAVVLLIRYLHEWFE